MIHTFSRWASNILLFAGVIILVSVMLNQTGAEALRNLFVGAVCVMVGLFIRGF